MRRLLSISLLLAGGAAARPAAAQIDHGLARADFADAERAARSQERLWPKPLYGPMLFADRQTRQVVANAPDSAGLLHPDGDLWVGTLPPDQPIYNGAMEWAGRRWTMLGWPLTAARYDGTRLLTHELFHRIQPSIGLPMSNPDNAHLDEEIGRVWLRLEWRALQAALAASGQARVRAVSDALAFRAYRHARIPGARVSETALELNEGLAEYTGVMAAIPPAARVGWALKVLDSGDAAAVDGTVVRNFAYTSGPAYGLLLDEAAPGWRVRLRPASDLGAMLAAAYHISPDTTDAGVRRRLGPYAGEVVIQQEAERSVRRAAVLAGYRKRFFDGPTLTLTGTDKFNYSFDPNGVVPFGDAGTIYLGMNVTDAWGALDVTGGGVLLARDSAGARLIAPAPTSPTTGSLRVDGWELKLAPGWELAPAQRAGSFVVRRRQE